MHNYSLTDVKYPLMNKNRTVQYFCTFISKNDRVVKIVIKVSRLMINEIIVNQLINRLTLVFIDISTYFHDSG